MYLCFILILFAEATADVPLYTPEKKTEPLGIASVQSEPLGISTPPEVSRDSSKEGNSTPDTPVSSEPSGLPAAARAPAGFRPAGVPKEDEVMKV